MKLSIVVSVYNEEEALPRFYEEITRQMALVASDSFGYELLFVNDGSTDDSMMILRNLAERDPQVRVIRFSRNFGHEAAMIAGIDHADGDLILCMDADLQHPVTCIPEILQAYADGYEIINMVRTSNKDAGFLKNLTSNGFYWVINTMSTTKMAKNASDFFAISRRAADVLRHDYREKIRFLRGYVQNIGFRKTTLNYEAADRVAGKSKYSLARLFRFSMNTIMCFSDAPLRLGIYAGVLATVLGIIMTIYTIVTKIRTGTPGGYATIVILICFMFAILFFMVGIIGEYIAVIFAEIKNRPIYIIEESVNGDGSI